MFSLLDLRFVLCSNLPVCFENRMKASSVGSKEI